MPRKAWAVIVPVLAATAVLLAMTYPGQARWEVVLSISAFGLVVDRTAIAVGARSGAPIFGSMAFPLCVAAAMVATPFEAALVGVVLGFGTDVTSLGKHLFNAGTMALSAGGAALVVEAAGQSELQAFAGSFEPTALLVVIAAGVVYCLINALLLACVLWVAQDVSPRVVLRATLVESAPSYVGYGFVGLLMAATWGSLGVLAAPLVVAPLLLARWAWAQQSRVRESYEATIRTLVQAVETKDGYTRGHSERVARASVLIASRLTMSAERLDALRYAAILHDVGKLGVPTKILQKTTTLTDPEFAAVQMHPVRGTEMLQDISFLDEAFQGILHHHERLDGLGYPMGLSGERIPEFARIIAVADAFDSMTSTRSYRYARTVPEALGELEACRGSQFDPAMVDALVAALRTEHWEPTGPLSGAPMPLQAFDDDDPTLGNFRVRSGASVPTSATDVG